MLNRLHHLLHYVLASGLPHSSISKSVVEILVARHAKHAAVLEFLGKRDDVEVKESQLALVPSNGWIGFGTPVLVRRVTFTKESFIPLAILLEEKKRRSKEG